MELWLLVGAVVLIALTVWIVWPAQRSEEVTGMTSQPNIPPQGADFEDQYTSATADLSAGGVATARETGAPVSMSAAMPETAAASEAWAAPATAREGLYQPSLPAPQQRGITLTQPRTIGAGAATLLAIGSGVGGAWLYQRWQRERSRPINRVRRGARTLLSRVPEFDYELPEAAAPIGGGTAAALLVSSVLVARAMRRTSDPRDTVVERMHEAREQAQSQQRNVRMRMPMRTPPPRQAVLGGLGLGGTAIAIGGGLLIWRLLKGRDDGPHHLYVTDRMGE